MYDTGFYRTLYDDKNWELIATQLQNDHSLVPSITRAQLLSDALNLARSGHMTYDVALDLTTYLDQETEYAPWAAALKAFSFIDARLAGIDTHQYFEVTSTTRRVSQYGGKSQVRKNFPQFSIALSSSSV